MDVAKSRDRKKKRDKLKRIEIARDMIRSNAVEMKQQFNSSCVF